MKLLLVVCFAATVVFAEPPRFNSKYPNQFQRQELPQYQQSGWNQFQRQEEAPYQPSGWRPSGAQFNLPQRQQEKPQDQYGPPPPPPDYLPPAENSTEAVDSTTTQDPNEYDYLDQFAESPKKNATKNEKLKKSDEVKEEGAYYIYHPTGLLQRVMYVTKNDATNMAFTAQLRYKNVEPIKGPIFTYDPQTLVFTQVQP